MYHAIELYLIMQSSVMTLNFIFLFVKPGPGTPGLFF